MKFCYCCSSCIILRQTQHSLHYLQAIHIRPNSKSYYSYSAEYLKVVIRYSPGNKWSTRSNLTAGRISAAHGQFNCICQVHPHLIHASLGLSKSTSQMAYQLVQSFLHSLRLRVPIVYIGPPILTSKYTVPLAHPCPHLKRHLDWLSRFCRAHDCDSQTNKQIDRLTDRQTDHPSLTVAIGRTYIILRCVLIIIVPISTFMVLTSLLQPLLRVEFTPFT